MMRLVEVQLDGASAVRVVEAVAYPVMGMMSLNREMLYRAPPDALEALASDDPVKFYQMMDSSLDTWDLPHSGWGMRYSTWAVMYLSSGWRWHARCPSAEAVPRAPPREYKVQLIRAQAAAKGWLARRRLSDARRTCAAVFVLGMRCALREEAVLGAIFRMATTTTTTTRLE